MHVIDAKASLLQVMKRDGTYVPSSKFKVQIRPFVSTLPLLANTGQVLLARPRKSAYFALAKQVRAFGGFLQIFLQIGDL